MRFLILSQYFPPEIGAPQVRWAAVIRELLRLGHTVEVVTALPNYPEGHIFPDYQQRFAMTETWETQVLVHRVWIYAAKGAGWKRLLNYFSFLVTAIFGLRKAQKPDYLIVESPPLFLGITGYLAAKWWKVPFVFNIADLWPDCVRALGILQPGVTLTVAERLEAWLYKKATFINAVSFDMQDILIQQKQVPSHKVLFLPNGVDTHRFRPQPFDVTLQTQLGLPNQPIFLYTGTHGYTHGMEVILQAAQLLNDTNVLFLLVGGGSEKPRLQQRCQEMGLTNVMFQDSKPPDQIAPLYSLAMAGICTLRDSPLLEWTRLAKVLAIMACGKPVLYSGAGEGSRLVKQANAGLVVPPQDPVALANAVRYLMNHPKEAIEFGNQGRMYVETHLQWSTVVANWLQQLVVTKYG